MKSVIDLHLQDLFLDPDHPQEQVTDLQRILSDIIVDLDLETFGHLLQKGDIDHHRSDATKNDRHPEKHLGDVTSAGNHPKS